MPHIKTNDKYYIKKEIIIYAILFPGGNQIYVGKTLKRAIKNHYKNHYILRNSLTKNLFVQAKANSIVPKMYLLEELETVEVEAYRHCVAWIKYFEEHGFECIAHTGTKEYAKNLWENTREIYEEIQSRPIAQVLGEDKILVSSVREYRKNKANDDPNDYDFIGFRVSKDDAEIIRTAAEKKKWTVSEYCRAAAVDGCIVNVDYNFLWRYMKELARMNRLLEQTMYTIQVTGNYHPQDLANIQRTLDLVVEQQKIINEDMTAIMKKTQKEIRAARRNLKK